MRLAIANQRKAKKLMRVWEAQTLNLIELTTQKLPRTRREFTPPYSAARHRLRDCLDSFQLAISDTPINL
jgi:hypothetical protein